MLCCALHCIGQPITTYAKRHSANQSLSMPNNNIYLLPLLVSNYLFLAYMHVCILRFRWVCWRVRRLGTGCRWHQVFIRTRAARPWSFRFSAPSQLHRTGGRGGVVCSPSSEQSHPRWAVRRCDHRDSFWRRPGCRRRHANWWCASSASRHLSMCRHHAQLAGRTAPVVSVRRRPDSTHTGLDHALALLAYLHCVSINWYTKPELDMGPIFLIQPNPIQSISDPIQCNPYEQSYI